MQVWGKILGCVFGYMFARIPGAILGLIIGHLFDKGYARSFDQIGGFSSLVKNKVSLKSRAIFFHTLFSIMGHIAKSSGRVTEADIQLASQLMSRLGLNDTLKKEAQVAYREGKKNDFPIKETVKDFKTFCAGRREFTQMYLEIQIQAAIINGALNNKAKEILTTIAKILGFQTAELNKLIEQVIAMNNFHEQDQQQQRQQKQSTTQQTNLAAQVKFAYTIIGITPKTAEKDARKAYKKLMAQHHPDKLMSQGLPEQALELAKEKTQDIQTAWDLIKQQHNWR